MRNVAHGERQARRREHARRDAWRWLLDMRRRGLVPMRIIVLEAKRRRFVLRGGKVV